MAYPQLPPLKYVKNGKYCYLVTFKNKWENGQSVSVKGETKTVGQIERGDLTGKVIWREFF